jgi:hypothetical protein
LRTQPLTRSATSRSTVSPLVAERVIHLPEVVEVYQQRRQMVAALRHADRPAQRSSSRRGFAARELVM